MAEIPPEFRDLFEKRSFAFVVTLLPDGSPHVTPTWVGFDGEHVLVNVVDGSRKDKNVRKDARVALAIADPENPYRYLSVRGEVIERREEGAREHLDELAERYTQLPASTPDRVARRTANLVGADATRYEAARRIQQWLQTNREYSLEVEKPSGNIADSFLFEMDAGYCTYYATTMVTMLRSQGVPARFVVGYTTGEQVGDDRYRVRGLNSHAWVQVYFPDVGWVRFDPTPAGPREAAEERQIRQTEGNGTESGPNSTGPAEGSDTDVVNLTPTTPVPDPNVTATVGNEPATPSVAGADDGSDELSLPDLPSNRTVAVWAVTLAGLLAVGRRTGALGRVRTAVALGRQSRSAPDADAIRAYDRLETLFELRYRPRAAGETPRTYVSTLVADGAEEAALSVVDAYEQARHGDGVDKTTADDVVATVDRFVDEWSLGDRLGR